MEYADLCIHIEEEEKEEEQKKKKRKRRTEEEEKTPQITTFFCFVFSKTKQYFMLIYM